MKRHATCFVGKAGFEPRTLGTKEERYDLCITRPVARSIQVPKHTFKSRFCDGIGGFKFKMAPMANGSHVSFNHDSS
jgi:hypothetical protein